MSKLLQRSGSSVVAVCEKLGWQPEVVVQVGVGVHFDEVIPMQAAWPSVQFVGCEPHPRSFRSAASRYPGKLLQTAVSNFEGRAILHTKGRHSGGNSLLPHATRNKKNSYGEVEVGVITLSALFRRAGIRSNDVLLWLDCEGMESWVLEGAGDALSQVRVVNVELTAGPVWVGQRDPFDVHRMLCRRGFVFSWVHTTRIAAGQFDAVFVDKELASPHVRVCPCGWGESVCKE